MANCTNPLHQPTKSSKRGCSCLLVFLRRRRDYRIRIVVFGWSLFLEGPSVDCPMSKQHRVCIHVIFDPPNRVNRVRAISH